MELVEQVDDEKGAETVEEEGMASSEDMIWIGWWEGERERMMGRLILRSDQGN